MTYKALLVEDDLELAALTRDYLAKHDIHVTLLADPALLDSTMAQLSPDLVLLDIMLPGKDGLTLCRELRRYYYGPIVMLTSLDSDMNQIIGLELGANDYILKSTPPAVVAARLRAQLRQHQQHKPAEAAQKPHNTMRLVLGSLHIDEPNREVLLAGERILLTTIEFDLLWQLASHAGETQERETLLRTVRGLGYDGMDRSIDIAISRLRKKLGDDANAPFRIKTIRNKGYLLSPDHW